MGELLRLCTKYTIYWKTFTVHQAVAIMYCTQQVIQGENFHDRLKNHKSFPTRKFCCIQYFEALCAYNYTILTLHTNSFMRSKLFDSLRGANNFECVKGLAMSD